jgi:hypothetical protein
LKTGEESKGKRMRSGDRPGLQKWAALAGACVFKDITRP